MARTKAYPFQLTPVDEARLIEAARDPKNHREVRTDATILLVLASAKTQSDVTAARLGVSPTKLSKTKAKFMAKGLAAIVGPQHFSSPVDDENFRRRIEEIIRVKPALSFIAGFPELAANLGLSTREVRRRCHRLGIDVQALGSLTIRSRLEEILKSKPPGKQWTFLEIGTALGTSDASVPNYLRKFGLKIPTVSFTQKIARAISKAKGFWNYNSIARECDVRREDVISHCKACGTKRPSKSAAIMAAITESRGKWTYSSVARDCGLSISTVIRYCRAGGIKSPDVRSHDIQPNHFPQPASVRG